MVYRTKKGYIYYSNSYDLGQTWTEAKPTNLFNPDSKVAIMNLDASRHVLAYNPT